MFRSFATPVPASVGVAAAPRPGFRLRRRRTLCCQSEAASTCKFFAVLSGTLAAANVLLTQASGFLGDGSLQAAGALTRAPLRRHALAPATADVGTVGTVDHWGAVEAVHDIEGGNGTAFALRPGALPLRTPAQPAAQYQIDTFSPGFVVDNVLSVETSRRLVDLVENIGFMPRWNSNLGVVTLFIDEELERSVFERLQPYLADHMGARPLGVNRRWAVIKYGPGQYMNSHVDGHVPGTQRNGDSLEYMPATRSYMSALFWLADDVVGGETVFTYPQGGTWVKIPPKTGAALLFNHGLNAVSNPLHHGGSVEAGTKYLVRSDIIYSL